MGLRDRLVKLLDPTGDASTATFCDCEDPARGDAVPPGCERSIADGARPSACLARPFADAHTDDVRAAEPVAPHAP